MGSYGDTIRKLRVAANIKQGDLAEHMDLRQTDLCESELGNREMTESEYIKARQALLDLIAERDEAYAQAKAEVAG